MSRDFNITLDDQVFKVSSPIPPENEFVKYRPIIPLHDEGLFKDSGRVMGLQVHWKYRSAWIRKVSGVLEMQVKAQAARDYRVDSLDGLKRQLLEDFKRELTQIGYAGAPVQFESVLINGREWVRYQVPVLGVTEYSTSLSSDRFLTVQFAFVDNTGEKAPPWLLEAKELVRDVSGSMQLR